MTKVTYNGVPYGGAQVAAFLGAQSVVRRLNAGELLAAGAQKKHYLACRLIVTLPIVDGAPEVSAVYEDVGEMDAGASGANNETRGEWSGRAQRMRLTKSRCDFVA
ncbi:MAG TPA: hypothetical protein VG186_04395 [Solirubrobacteraceae bacterium]|jgi:hypothetical protein|nr:hypothetical protein [Solirubrobacteraceae bacterium]